MLLELKNISKSYDEHIIFENLNIQLGNSGFYLLTGPSGCGKTTLLNILSGYESFEYGERVVHPNVLISSVFQNYELIDTLTVQENIMLPYILCNQEEDDYAHMIVEKLGLIGLFRQYPNELSQGQKQRVGIARALLMKPDIVICDEPTESLDTYNKNQVIELLKTLSETKIVIIASHDKLSLNKYVDVFMEINNQKLNVDKKERSKCQINCNQNKIKDVCVKKIINKIIHRKTIFACFILSIFIITQIILYLFSQQLFKPLNYDNVLNYQTIYVSFLNRDYLNLKGFKNKKELPRFVRTYIDENNINSHIYPLPTSYQKSNLIAGNYPQKPYEVLINTSLSHNWKSFLGETIYVDYCVNAHDKNTLKFKITGVINEEAVPGISQIYFQYDDLVNDLKQHKSFDRNYENQYQFLKDNTSQFALEYEFGDLEKYYEYYNDELGVFAHNAYLNECYNQKNIQDMYKLLFGCVQIILFLVSVVFVIIYSIRDLKNISLDLSVLHTINVPIYTLKKYYFQNKIHMFLASGFITFVSIQILNLLLWNINIQNIIYEILYLTIIIFISILSYYLSAMRINKKNILNTFKERNN